jgi:polyferredoxin
MPTSRDGKLLGIVALVLGVMAFAALPLLVYSAAHSGLGGWGGVLIVTLAGPAVIGLALLLGVVGLVMGLAARTRQAPQVLWIPAVLVPLAAVLGLGYIIGHTVLHML